MLNDLEKSASIGTVKKSKFLLDAWKEINKKSSPRQREYTSGIDSITLNKFKENLFENLKSISKDIVSPEGYQFSPLKPVFIKKKNGKDRLICIPTVSDRIVQKSVQLVLQRTGKWKYSKFNGINYGFVKKKSVGDAIKRVIKLRNRYPYIFKTDITSFFDDIDRIELKKIIRRKVRSRSLHNIIERMIDCEIDKTDKTVLKRLRKMRIEFGKGVRQGMSISPLVANLYLSDFDRKLIDKKMWAVRYADDLIFFAENTEQCGKIHKFCKKELHSLNLDIPEVYKGSKSEIIQPECDADFLGICITYESEFGYLPTVSKLQQEEIRNNILKHSDMDYLNLKKITLRNYSSKLRAIIAGYSGVYKDCANISTLNSSMENWVRKALKTLLNSNYKINYDGLSDKQKKFLDVLN
jgi:group II intron reverse transcriptase/maturase